MEQKFDDRSREGMMGKRFRAAAFVGAIAVVPFFSGCGGVKTESPIQKETNDIIQLKQLQTEIDKYLVITQSIKNSIPAEFGTARSDLLDGVKKELRKALESNGMNVCSYDLDLMIMMEKVKNEAEKPDYLNFLNSILPWFVVLMYIQNQGRMAKKLNDLETKR